MQFLTFIKCIWRNRCYSIPAKVTTIPYACFANCTELQSIEMPGVTTIDDYAFQGLNMPGMQIGKKV
ncbi:leucine-rich repeat protein, partial [Vibrio cholerae]|uniref:leucine-rich repeat protein n=1 Tax=Vibrio cholerae TaxID=666 RepID=UPI001C0F72AA|nr:leucine-rich repeat protein [Vibrio cholerae O1]